MTDRVDLIRDLCARAVSAGLAPAIVAGWGRVDTNSVVAGQSMIEPRTVHATRQTLFDLASLTKPLATTTLSLLAFRQGALSLSTKIREVLVELRGTDIGEITVENILTHSAGFPAWLPLYCVAGGDPGKLTERLGRIDVSRPGKRVVYSCLGFVLLGKMLEVVYGEPLDLLFRREVAIPLGIESEIGFRPDPADPRLAGGATQATVERGMVLEMGDDPELIPRTEHGLPDDGNARFLGGVAGNAGLFGSLDGVVRLAREWLGPKRRVLAAEEVDLATRYRTVGLEQERGLGWQLAGSPGCSAGPALDRRAWGHTGFTGVSLWIDPDLDSFFALLTNRNHPSQRNIELHPLRRRYHSLAVAALE